jgi:tetratricopeptide (TPR) repeat protein
VRPTGGAVCSTRPSNTFCRRSSWTPKPRTSGSSPWHAYTNRGWAELQLGQLDAANASFLEALAFRRTYWPARLNLGILEAKRGQPLAAIVNFERVLERDIGKAATSEVNYHLGQAYVRMGRRDKAVKYFQKSASVAPYSRWAEQSAEYLRILH